MSRHAPLARRLMLALALALALAVLVAATVAATSYGPDPFRWTQS